MNAPVIRAQTWGAVPVPWTVAWSGEEGFYIGAEWSDGRPALCQIDAPGQGKPRFGSPHSVRQRRCILEDRCDLCGRPLRNATKVSLSHAASRSNAAHYMDVLQVEPLLHRACALLSARHCPSLKRDIAAGAIEVRQVTRHDFQLAVMTDEYAKTMVPTWSGGRVIGHAKVWLKAWIDRDAAWLGLS